MVLKTDGKFCKACQSNVMAQANKPNHLLHLILTIATLGGWAIVWLILAVASIGNYRCTRCGLKV